MFEFLPEDPKELIAYATAATLLGGLAVKALHVVEKGEKGVVVRNGKPVRTVGPGPKIAVPPIWHIKSVNVRDRTSQLNDAQFAQDDQFWKADVSVTWAVNDDDKSPEKALFNVEPGELDDTVRAICSDGLTQVFDELKGQTIENFGHIKQEAIKISNIGLHQYGVSVKRFNIFNPTLREAEILSQALKIGGAAFVELMAQGVEPGELVRGDFRAAE